MTLPEVDVVDVVHRVITAGLEVPEGPVALVDGDVLVAEIKGGRLTRVSANGTTTVVAELGGGPNGAALGPDGRVYVCNNGGSAWVHVVDELYLPQHRPAGERARSMMQIVDLRVGLVEEVYQDEAGHPFNSLNDLVFDAQGGCYFTDFGRAFADVTESGHVYYADPGFVGIRRVLSGLSRPNGCGLSPEEDRFYVSETTTGRVWWWRVEQPGVLVGGETFRGSGGGNLLYGAAGFDLFDSMAVDRDGRVCVATYFDRGVSVISPNGAEVTVLRVADRLITNLAFSPDWSTAYLTAVGSGALLAIDWPWRSV